MNEQKRTNQNKTVNGFTRLEKKYCVLKLFI